MSTAIDPLFFVESLINDNFLMLSGENLTYYRIHKGNISAIMLDTVKSDNLAESLYKNVLFILQSIKWLLFVEKLLPANCKCNPYRSFAISLALRFDIMPLNEIRYISLQLRPSLRELIDYIDCKLKFYILDKKSPSKVIFKGFELVFRATFPIIAVLTGSLTFKKILYKISK
ncbi:MAG: hypothetical protein ACP5HC_09615, partial [Caldisericum sp.]